MSLFFEVAVAVTLVLIVGVPVVLLFDKAKKEMEADEEGDE